jgi:transcriptional regulator with XRE-family HTH domain
VEPLQRKFGEVVRRRRQAAGLSQEALADRAGLHRTYISLLERGQRAPSILVVQQLAKALDTTMASLVAEVEDQAV